MALDTTKPADSILLSELAAFIRANRVAINTNETSIAAGSALVYTILNVSGGATVMDIDTDLSAAMLEMVYLTGSGAADIAEITGGTAGQVKIFMLGDANVRFERDLTKIALNQSDAETYYGGVQYDVIAFVNIGGDPVAPDNGIWWELFRTPRV